MNDDELKKLWQQQTMNDRPLSAAQLISAMQNKASQFRRDIRARDLRELFACAVVAIIFGFYAFIERTPIVRLGWLMVIAGAIFVAGKLIHSRRSAPLAAPGATIVEALRAELNSVRIQSRLLGSVLWWYLLPLGLGLLVATWGMPIHLHAKIPTTLIYIAIFASIYWLNQWARSKHLLPMEAQLESMLRSADTGEPLDEIHVANLRPFVHSITAADQVKPAEFKVAFWQIALYGEIGFVGIWFFLMLARTQGDLSRMFVPKHLVWIVPFFLAGLLYSWLLQKVTASAVSISALGIHLSKGQNLVLWHEIVDVRPFRILNIRSLWIIQATGEKTIMPWTSLERHADLKAAVEAFAPPNHPIRNFLSLLRRTHSQ